MPLLGGFKITKADIAGRSSIFVDFTTAHTDQFAQLYVNRKLVGVTPSVDARRVEGQVWDMHLSSPPVNLMLVSADERTTDFGDDLEVEPWNRYALTFTVPADYDADTHHFEILGASSFDTAPTEVIANVPYVGPRTYVVDLPAIPTLPLTQPLSVNARSRWQNWLYRVVPRDNASPSGNSGVETDITIPSLIVPADLVIQDDGNRFGLSLDAGVLTASFALAN